MQEYRKREIRISADAFREKCKVSRYGIIDLFKDCKRLGYKLLRYPLEEKDVLGFAFKRDNDSIIFTNTCSRLSREIFTLAHEIGHSLLHIGEGTSFVDDQITISDKSTDVKEQEANYFAAYLLMPDDAVEKFLDLKISRLRENKLSAMDIAMIMSEFNVSFDTALNRLDNMGIFKPGERLRLDNEKSMLRVGKLLRSVGGNARLNMESNDIDIPYEYIDYVIYNYNHLAIPKETLEQALQYYHLSLEDVGDRLIEHHEEEDLDVLIGGLKD